MLVLNRRDFLRTGAAAGILATIAPKAHAATPVLRVGYIGAAEEQLMLLIAKPSLGQNHGKSYTIEASTFRSGRDLAQAWEAKAVDISSFSGSGLIFGAAAGLQGKAICSIARESQRGFSTSFYAKDSSDITSVPAMKGKVIGLNGLNSASHLWLIAALRKHGMTDKEVQIVVVGFGAMQESLRAGRIDVGTFPQPFAAVLEKQDRVRKVFDAKYGVPFDEELVVLTAKEEFLKSNSDAVKGFLADLKSVTSFYLSKGREARQILIDSKMARVDPDIYLSMKDYFREPSLQVSVEALEKMQEQQLEAKFQEKRVDVKALVDHSYLLS
jgi:ABC-type nitrate/sulfonate/bicarbonate transport system substrate-binding protein